MDGWPRPSRVSEARNVDGRSLGIGVEGRNSARGSGSGGRDSFE